jgi:hypothetical protein
MRPWLLALTALVACEMAPRRSALDLPMWRSWPATQSWDDALEVVYGRFVETLGRAVERRVCQRLDECLASPEANLLYDAAVDDGLHLDVDCADLPYVLRAYFSFKVGLPFGFVSLVRGRGDDIRYAVDVRPAAVRSWRDFPTPRRLLGALIDAVHSGMYRVEEDGDFYPVRIDRRAIRPGAVYYDPLGHVSVVVRVDADGSIRFIEAMPAGTLTWRRFGSGYSLGIPEAGGGFKRFRPQSLAGGRLVRADSSTLADFDPVSQHDPTLRVVDGRTLRFHEWVEARLRLTGTDSDEIAEFHERVRAVCRQVIDRVESVELATRAGIPGRPHPRALPANIYGARGVWETHATAARDARLRAALVELTAWTRDLEELVGLAATLRRVWAEEARSPACRVTYHDSLGIPVTLTLDDVVDRLFDLSFDPYHCPELRWGAPAGSAERATCPDGAADLRWYEAERRLRHRVDRATGKPTPLEAGPDTPPPADVRRLFADDRPWLEL